MNGQRVLKTVSCGRSILACLKQADGLEVEAGVSANRHGAAAALEEMSALGLRAL